VCQQPLARMHSLKVAVPEGDFCIRLVSASLTDGWICSLSAAISAGTVSTRQQSKELLMSSSTPEKFAAKLWAATIPVTSISCVELQSAF
jgi:hypothetical protein